MTLTEMLKEKRYPGMAEGLNRIDAYPTNAYNAPSKFCLFFKSSSTYGGKQRATLEEAIEDANRVNKNW